jgi:hypothetical protein
MKKNIFLKLLTMTLSSTVTLSSQAVTTLTTDQGTIIKFIGDVELDDIYQNTISDTKLYDQAGRLKFTVSSLKELANSYVIKTSGQLRLNIDNSNGMTADDAWISIGKNEEWEVKLGRFEAYNLFPTGQDVAYTNAMTVYNAGAARGRSNNGQINLSKIMGPAYFELSTTFDPLNNGGTTTVDGVEVSKADTNAVFLRPVFSVGLGDALRLTTGAEINVTKDELDTDNNFTGYGATLNYSAETLSINLNYATRDFDNSDSQKDTSLAFNAQYGNAFVGYVNAVTETDNKDKMNTYYASYKFANIMDVQDLALYLAASTSKVQDSTTKDTTVKLRVKYTF